MRHLVMLASLALGAALAFACGSTDVVTSKPYYGPSDDGGDGINMTGVGAGTGANTGLPCDVQQLLENRCIGCHAGPSPAALLTYANLTAPSSDPSKTEAQRCLERMQSTTSPMPPAPAVAPTAPEIATFAAWVAAGTPMGAACTSAVDGGAGGGGNYGTPTVCTSGKTWAGGEASGSMNPGGACLTCHSKKGGPPFSIGGTVYPTAHEPNDCNGVNGKLTVVVTDKNGKVTNLPVNAVGNFYTEASIAPPFNVKVTDGTKTRSMATALTAGDCNTCHTVAGANGAPGRIMAP